MDSPYSITFWALAGFVASIVFTVFSIVRSKTQRIIDLRLSNMRSQPHRDPAQKALWDSALNLFAKFFPEQNSKSADLRSRLRLAGFFSNRACAAYQFIRAATMLAGVLIGSCLFWFDQLHDWIPIAGMLVGAGIGFLIPGIAIEMLQKRRYRQILSELPDFSDLLIVCLNAGMSLEAAIRFVADEFGQSRTVLKHELRIVKHDLSLGLSVDEAFKRLSERCKHDAIGMLSTFMRESRKMGSSVLESINRHCDAIRVQIEQEAEEQSQKAAVKMMFPTLLLVMPATFVVLAGPAVLLIQESFCK